MRPYDVKSEADIISMQSDNFGEVAHWSILNHSGIVSIHAPHGRGYVEIPRDQFNAIIDWYTADQAVKP